MARYTLESIGIIGFGVSLGAFSDVGAEISSSFGDAFNTATARTSDRFVDPTWPIKRLLGIGKERELAESIKLVRSFAMKVIKERRMEAASDKEGANLQDLPDLLSRFMFRKKGSGEEVSLAQRWRSILRQKLTKLTSFPPGVSTQFEFTNEELYYIIINFVLAGRDTTTNSLTWTLWELSKECNKRCVDMILQETERNRVELGLAEGEVRYTTGAEWLDMTCLTLTLLPSLRFSL